jgi:uncharacterized delta-60 repeat protein
MKTKNYILLFILFLVKIQLITAQVNMQLDPSFGAGGIYKNVINNEFFAYNLFSATQSDGKILNAGFLGNYNTGLTDTLVVYRFNTNGTLDNSFGNDGAAYALIPSGQIFNNNYLNALTIQSDGKILILAEGIDTVNFNRTILARFNENGTLDNTFGQSGIAFHSEFLGEYYTSIKVQSSGKILISGVMLQNDGLPHAILTRLNSNGTPDTLFDATYGDSKIFDPMDGNTGSVNANLMVTPNGSLLMDVAKQVTIQGTQLSGNLSLIRLNADGTTDSSFGVNGATEPLIFSINNSLPKNAILNLTNGKYAIAHYDTDSTYIKMFNANGTNDPNFNVNGKLTFSTPTPKDFAMSSLFETNNGSLIFSRSILDSTDAMMNEYASHLLIGVNANGTIMNTFGTNGFLKTDLGKYGLIGVGSKQTDGKLVFPAYSFSTKGFCLRYESAVPNSINKQNLSNNDISIFPNPFNSAINIKYHTTEQTKTIITIYDLTGKEIVNQIISNPSPGDYCQTITMPADTQAGSYLCKVINNNNINSYLISYIK